MITSVGCDPFAATPGLIAGVHIAVHIPGIVTASTNIYPVFMSFPEHLAWPFAMLITYSFTSPGFNEFFLHELIYDYRARITPSRRLQFA